MPFTFSHAAAILPFRNVSHRKLSLTALTIGSMVPDFEFFFRMKADTDISHTIPGIFLFDIPVVVLLSFLYHGWVRDPFLQHLPNFLFQRFSVYQRFNWMTYFQQYWLIVLFSALIGTITHFICDAFTHHHGWFVKQFGFLATSFTLLGFRVPIYFFLQYFSSLVLGLILIIIALKMPREKGIGESKGFLKYWTFVVLLTAVCTALRYWHNMEGVIFNDIIMTIIAGGLLGICICSTFCRFTAKDQHSKNSVLKTQE